MAGYPFRISDISSAALTLTAIGTLVYTFSRDRGVHTQRARVLAYAKNRMDYWNTRINIQKETLSPKDLGRAKEEANRAIEAIHNETNENLATLTWRRSATPVIGLSIVRKLFLFYKPIEGSKLDKRVSYLARVCYIASLLFAGILGYTFFWSLWVSSELPAKYLSGVHLREEVIVVRFLYVVVLAYVFFQVARKEKRRPELKEIDRL